MESSIIKSSVYVGRLRRRRFSPVRHEFTYPLFMVLLDIDRLPELMKVSPFAGYNRWNWASYQERDHFGDPGKTLRERMLEDARRKGVELPDGRIFLLTHLRYLGYNFNPVSFYYCKDFTHGCTIEAHNFQRDQAHYQRKNAVVLGVSVDSADSHRQFCTKEGLNFKLLADTDHKVSAQYGSLTNFWLVKFASRHTFIINPGGKIVRVFTEVNPNQHSEKVLAALAELQQQAGSSR